MYPSVQSVVPNEDFTVTVALDNGDQGILDMKPYLDFGVFRRITDYEQFKRVRVAFDAIQRDCGVNLDPEFVCAKCRTIARAEPATPSRMNS